MYSFSAEIFIIGVNPYVFIPENILQKIFQEVGREKGPIPIKGTINGNPFIQTLVKYQGAWRLYVNGIMIRATEVKVGDRAEFVITVDKTPREVPMHPVLKKALETNAKAKATFAAYPPSRQKEINRYLHNIKSKDVLEKNIDKIVRHLLGETVDYFVLLRNKK